MRNHKKAKLIQASCDLPLKEEDNYSKIPQVCLCSYHDVANELTKTSLHIWRLFCFLYYLHADTDITSKAQNGFTKAVKD